MRLTLFVGFALASLSGCSGKPLTKIEESAPGALPLELQSQFEVQDAVEISSHPGASVNAPEPASQPTPPTSDKASLTLASTKKKGKVGKQDSAFASPPPPTTSPAHFDYPNRRPPKDPIWLSETQVFQITYFGMSAGTFTVKVFPYKVVNHRKVYHVRGNAVSSALFSLFYKLDDRVETFIDYEGLFSHRFHLTLNETKQTRDSLELYDSEKKQTFYWNRWNHKVKGYIEIKDYFPMNPFSQDTLSALYYLRTVPLPDGKVFSFPVVSEGKTWDAEITVVRREMIDGPHGKVQAIVLKPETKYQGVLKKQGDSFLWLSDDDRRFLLRLEAKVRIGTVVAVLKSVELGTPSEVQTPLAPREEQAPSERKISSEAR